MSAQQTQTDQDKNAEIVFFEKHALTGAYERFHEESYEIIFKHFDALIKPRAGETILDVGCGTGAFTNRLRQKYPDARVKGVDLVSKNIETARRLYPNVSFEVADAEASQLPSSSVDVVSFFGLLHHFPDFSNTAREAFRVLKPGGRYFALDPHHHNPVFWLFRSKSSPLYNSAGVTANERLLTRTESTAIFSNAGFEARARILSGIKFCSVGSAKLKPFMGLYNFLDKVLAHTPLERLVGAWVISWGVKR